MQADHSPSPDLATAGGPGAQVTLSALQEVCERQAGEIRALNESLEVFRRGAHQLGVCNAALRADVALVRALLHARCPMPDAQRWERHLPVGDELTASRSAVADRLGDRVPHGVLGRAQSIVAAALADRPSGAGDAPPVLLRIESSATTVRVELDDPCRPAAGGDGERGLSVLAQLSHRWGGERLDGGGMRIWAQLSLLDPVLEDDAVGTPGAAG
jgi:hypothetical protein